MPRVYCTYCGKGFSRKEHLERHIPSHTNVKPHRCSACQLSFTRKDLLQRHYSTYHEARDYTNLLPNDLPTIAGRQPIACQNCATAKTGCDKRVPCSRCAERRLPCAPRFARQSRKTALRTAQTGDAFNGHAPQQLLQPQTVNPSSLAVNQGGVSEDSFVNSQCVATEDSVTIHSGFSERAPRKNSSAHSHISQDEFLLPHPRIDGLDVFMPVGDDFVAADPTDQDMSALPEYKLGLDIYSESLLFTSRTDVTAPAVTDMNSMSDTSGSTSSTFSTSTSSIYTSRASTMSTDTFDPQMKGLHTAISAIPSEREAVPDFEVVIAAESAWPLAQCNPYMSGSCPQTAIVHLECLEQHSKQEGMWSSLEKYLEQVDWDASDLVSVMPLTPQTRDKVLAITQIFFHKALEIHRGGKECLATGYTGVGDSNLIVLPPSKILEYFLRSYGRNLSLYYPLVAGGRVDPNEMIRNDQASTLLVLLMIAKGAAAMPIPEARYLAAGLTEICRISLGNLIDKDSRQYADPVVLQCGLTFTALGAWSGDKWLMDIAVAQRGMHLMRLKHAGMMAPQPSISFDIDGSIGLELRWRTWLHHEAQNRLVYNWAMLDQELSLFYDMAPMLSITELQCPLPGPELLWMAPNAEKWHSVIRSIHGVMTNGTPQLPNNSTSLPANSTASPSLSVLFQAFLHNSLSGQQSNLSPQHLRLLLHPLQSMLFHIREMFSCFSSIGPLRAPVQTVTKVTTLLRLEEVQNLLKKWYELAGAYWKANPDCPMTRCNLVLYHLISLNAVSNFGEIERLARREVFDGSRWELSVRHKRCIFRRDDAILHCGQVFKLLRQMPPDRRPTWWPVAVYRATLVLWADSIASMEPKKRAEKNWGDGGAGQVGTDQMMAEDRMMETFNWNGSGAAALENLDGTIVELEKPGDVLKYGIKALDEAVSSRIVDGIRRKLIALGNYWSVDAMGGASS